MIIKFEKIREVGKVQIGSFVNDPKFKIINDNISREKSYNELYREFCLSIRLPKEFIKKQYSSKYAKFFYTDEELSSFTKKWS